MEEEYERELRRYIQAATDKLPFIPNHRLRGGVVGLERQRIGATGNARYLFHERVVRQYENPKNLDFYSEDQILTLTQRIGEDAKTMRTARIANNVVTEVTGFEEMVDQSGILSEGVMTFAAISLLIGFVESKHFMFVEEKKSAGIVKL
jgi:hypothetical protein